MTCVSKLGYQVRNNNVNWIAKQYAAQP